MSMFFSVLAAQKLLSVAEVIRQQADFAVALHKLTAEATTCLTVRRSSDNAEADFGFASADLGAEVDWAAIGAWVGTGNTGYVSKWWDQSVNERHFVQTVAAYQSACWLSSDTAPTSFSANVLYGNAKAYNITNIGAMCQGASSTQLTYITTDRGVNQSASLMPVYFYRLYTAATMRMNTRKGHSTSTQINRKGLYGGVVLEDPVVGPNYMATGDIENCLFHGTLEARWHQGVAYLTEDRHNAAQVGTSASLGRTGETFGSNPVTAAVIGFGVSSSQHDFGEFIQFSGDSRNGILLWADVVAEQKARYPV